MLANGLRMAFYYPLFVTIVGPYTYLFSFAE